MTTAGYDLAGQRISLTYPSGLELSYDYDLNGNVTRLQDSRAGDAVYALDPDGRLLTEQLPGRLARRYRYDHGLLARFTVIRDGHPVTRTAFTHDPDGRVATQRQDGQLTHYRYDPAGQLTSIVREDRTVPRVPGRPRPHRPEPGHDRELPDLQLTYDVLGNRHSLRRGEVETHYRYDAASQLLGLEGGGRRAEFRYDSAGRLTEEHDGDQHRTIRYNGFGQPVSVTRDGPRLTEHSQAVFNGNALLAALTLTREQPERDEQRAASVRYLWLTDNDQIPQIQAQAAQPQLDDAERDGPGRLDADFAYGYGRTFASSRRAAAPFHTDAYRSALRTEDTEPWALAERYSTFGAPEDDREPDEHRELAAPELPRFGYRGELSLGPLVYLRARSYDTVLGRFTTPDPLAFQPRQVPAASPYTYARNDPLNTTDPLGLFSFGSILSHVVHAVSHVVHGVQHVMHAVAGTVTKGVHIVAGGVAHAFEAVHTVLAQVAATAQKDAARLAHVVRDAATHVVHVVRDAVERSAGVVSSAVNQATTWIKKHNQIIGKIGSVLSNISGDLALAGLVIAPIPGLDALTPVLEGAAAATAIGALVTQGVARAAGDSNITYGDLFGDALGAIPGGEDAEDAVRGLGTASHLTEDAAEEEASTGARTLFHYTTEENQEAILKSRELNPSLKEVNPSDARYGNGQYLSDIKPGTYSNASLSARFLRNPYQGARFSHYVEIDVSGLDVVEAGRECSWSRTRSRWT